MRLVSNRRTPISRERKRGLRWKVFTLVLSCSAGLVGAESPNRTLFGPTILNKRAAPTTKPQGMVWIPGGEFSMGSGDAAELCGTNEPVLDAQPVHRVYVDGFWMDATEVTNAH